MKYNTEKLTTFQRNAAIEYLLETASDEQRTGLMHELPKAFNVLMGCEVMAVTQKRSDRPSMEPGPLNGHTKVVVTQ